MANAPIDLLAIERGTITAPAGCGKTHLIAHSLTRHAEKKPALILTHTNAGVAALRRKLDAFSVPHASYRLSTLDGWAMRLVSMFPAHCECDPESLGLEQVRPNYAAIREGAFKLLSGEHIHDILKASYCRLIVDEYQDCQTVQHEIICHASNALPTCVLGDPLQAIFDFGGALAHWEDHVCSFFPLAEELSTPWRWKNASEEKFGMWLLDVRQKLIGGDDVDLGSAHPNVRWIKLNGSNDYEEKLKACQINPPNRDGTVLIIGDSMNPDSHHQFASQTPGAVAVENVDLRDLVNFAQSLDLSSPQALSQILNFAQKTMTNVGGVELLQRVDILQRGTAKKPANDVESAALSFVAAPSYKGVRHLLGAIGQQAGVRNHRPAILRGCIRALQQVENSGEKSFRETAIRVREQARVLGRPLHRRSIGSTLLLKGLEADVAIILNPSAFNRRNLYVAMTRGARRLVVCSAKQLLRPQ